jgi:hypothetical protein
MNPYAPPASPAEPPRPGSPVRLFTAPAIAAHTLLLSPLIGSLLAATNYRRLGDRAAFWRTVLMFVIPGAALLAFSFAAGQGARKFLIYGANCAFAVMLFREHAPLVRKHLEAGGQKARWYLATLTAVGATLMVLAVWQFLTPVKHHDAAVDAPAELGAPDVIR